MTMEEMSPRRKTFVLNRGQYDQRAEEVRPGTPANVMAFSDRYPENRWGFAQWLVDENNPLTARVAVNRYWQMIFGRALVDPPHDFGVQGNVPTHPELLDWLAVDFMESGWDLRRLLKMFVTSELYQQSSAGTQEQLAKDPGNVYWTRAGSYRWPAEIIRDNALAVSGLLQRKVGGRSVKPYQPEGLWVEKTGPGSRYQQDKGAPSYRRSLYTYIRRTSPHPAMIAFDAPRPLGVCHEA